MGSRARLGSSCTWRRRLARSFSPAAALVGVIACASPTLPLPPPEQPTIITGADADHIALSATCGSAEPSADIMVENMNLAVPGDKAISGARADDCGAWDVPSVYAHEGDVLNITQEFGGVLSNSTSITVRLP
jgi:hypothetical protein